jgi:ABC-2 type transport system permease protein
MGRLLALIKKEFIHFYRDPVAMCLMIYHFTVCIFLCGYCFLVDAKHLSTVIYDMDRTSTSRDLIQSFLSTEYFDFDTFATSMADVEKRMDRGKAKVALIVPPKFTRDLARERPAVIQLISDGTDANQAGQAIGFAKRIIGTFNEKIVIERLKKKGTVVSHLPGINNRLRTLFNQEMEGVYYVVMFHIIIAGLIGGLVLSSTALVREKERGTIDQLMVTPTRSWELLIAKTIAPLTIALIGTVFSFLVVFWFQVPCFGNPLTFFAFMGIFLIGMTGIGICVGVLCKNMLQAILLCFVICLGSVFAAGVLSPLENISSFFQAIAKFNPTTYFNIAGNGIFQKGVGFSILWPEALKILGIGTGLFSLGCYVAWRQFRQ